MLIKAGKEVSVPEVSLGRLVDLLKDDYYDPKYYPRVEFAQRRGETIVLRGREAPFKGIVPEGCFIYERYDTPLEEVLDTAAALRAEHERFPDEEMRKHPHGIFNGRWFAEFNRRGL